jgi:hypothetical protein
LNDFNSMGRREVENAINTIATVGQNAVTALSALARQLYSAYNIQLGRAVSVEVPWFYISPISWWGPHRRLIRYSVDHGFQLRL